MHDLADIGHRCWLLSRANACGPKEDPRVAGVSHVDAIQDGRVRTRNDSVLTQGVRSWATLHTSRRDRPLTVCARRVRSRGRSNHTRVIGIREPHSIRDDRSVVLVALRAWIFAVTAAP